MWEGNDETRIRIRDFPRDSSRGRRRGADDRFRNAERQLAKRTQPERSDHHIDGVLGEWRSVGHGFHRNIWIDNRLRYDRLRHDRRWNDGRGFVIEHTAVRPDERDRSAGRLRVGIRHRLDGWQHDGKRFDRYRHIG